MKKLIPRIIDIICFLSGSVLLIYNLLNFTSRGGGLFPINPDYAYYFYYPEVSRILASIGLGLIILGFLIRSWRKEK